MSLELIRADHSEAMMFLFGHYDVLLKVIEAINFKGGEASIPSLKIATMLEENSLDEGLHSGEILKLLEKEDDDTYCINDLGEKWLSETKGERQLIIAKNILTIDPYRDIIYRTIVSESKSMKVDEIAKAFYIILGKVREEIRKQIIDSFVNYGVYCNLFEMVDDKANPRIKMTTNGEKLFEEYRVVQKAKRKAKKSGISPSVSTTSSSIISDLSCQSCGKKILPDYMMCPYCGTGLKRSCSNCGKELQPGWKMCPFCGTGN
ncbi:hypothetical protein NEF87_003544 [Candidatus Lokiarchaeum ossiferum]|uniref:DZANK-type domain-containing protein n=1 Tax=Candidatus Lokiarchaeum ossiferum TaxID=2951803 RepID=A0ABY6HUS9_9ARCH|nr:hypothetical protein NEF87_003544 [Candidatus Lokiarchaeum sp. B-35]